MGTAILSARCRKCNLHPPPTSRKHTPTSLPKYLSMIDSSHLKTGRMQCERQLLGCSNEEAWGDAPGDEEPQRNPSRWPAGSISVLLTTNNVSTAVQLKIVSSYLSVSVQIVLFLMLQTHYLKCHRIVFFPKCSVFGSIGLREIVFQLSLVVFFFIFSWNILLFFSP